MEPKHLDWLLHLNIPHICFTVIAVIFRFIAATTSHQQGAARCSSALPFDLQDSSSS